MGNAVSWRWVALAFAVFSFAPAAAQLPDHIRSASLTAAQEQELNSRLSQLSGRFEALARETDLRAAAVRNIAVEIYGAEPDLDFASYVAVISTSARELRSYITSARERREIAPANAALRERAIEAAEAGRLAEARALYDQLILISTETLEAQWAREDREREAARDAARLALAADIGEAAHLAFASAEYLEAADRFRAAAERAPQASLERWFYLSWQANSLREYGELFGDAPRVSEAVRIYRQEALPLAPRRNAPAQWALTQNDLGNALLTLAQFGSADGIGEAINAYEAALEVQTEDAAPLDWAGTQNNLGNAYLALAEHGDFGAALRAVSAFRAAAAIYAEATDLEQWAAVQDNLGSALTRAGHLSNATGLISEAVETHRRAQYVNTRERNPTNWAISQLGLGNALFALGTRGDTQSLRDALASYRLAAEVFTPESATARWILTQNLIGNALSELGERGERGALIEAVEAYASTLDYLDPETAPYQWAKTQFNLALAYRGLHIAGQRRYRAPSLEAARAALRGFEAAGVPQYVEQSRLLIADIEAH